MSVHLYALGVAGELRRRLDVDGLERIREAQLEHDRARLAAEELRPWKRRRALRDAATRFRETVAAAASLAGAETDA